MKHMKESCQNSTNEMAKLERNCTRLIHYGFAAASASSRAQLAA